MDEKQKNTQSIVKKNKNTLREIFNELQIIPLAPHDEYDRSIDIIISMLFKGASKEEIFAFVKNKFLLPYKAKMSDKSIVEIVDKIFVIFQKPSNGQNT